jgi:putative salt-induced outer membrane protein
MTARSRLPYGVLRFAMACLAATSALAQPPIKADGRWRATVDVAASYSSGNSDSGNFSLNADAVRATTRDRVSAYARSLYGRTEGETTAELLGGGGRYSFNLTSRSYVFGQADFLRDKPANIEFRASGAGGLGYKLLDTEADKFEVFAGLGYTHDRYFDATLVAGSVRSRYGYAEALLGEESNHRLTDSTTFKQKLVFYPNLGEPGDYRAVFDTGVAVAINRTLSLTVGFNYRYNTDPGVGVKRGDALFLTGLAYKLE